MISVDQNSSLTAILALLDSDQGEHVQSLIFEAYDDTQTQIIMFGAVSSGCVYSLGGVNQFEVIVTGTTEQLRECTRLIKGYTTDLAEITDPDLEEFCDQ